MKQERRLESGATYRSVRKLARQMESGADVAHHNSQRDGCPGATSKPVPDDSVTFQWFVEERYLPMRQGAWSPTYRKINTYEIKHYLVEHFGRIPLGQLGTFEIQVWLNKLAMRYSQSVVRHCHINIRSITHMALKLNFLSKDPAEDVMPQTKRSRSRG